MAAHEEDSAPGAPEWIVTFADMTSLLVTFFVMLLSFSTSEKMNLLPISGVKLIGTGGALEHDRTPSAVEPMEFDLMSAVDARRGATSPHSRPESELVDNLEEMGQLASDEYLPMDLRTVADGLVLSFGPDSSFEPGSAVVPPELRRSMADLGKVLQHYRHVVVVEGFTDAAFQPTPDWADAGSLGLARAAAAAGAMLDSSDLSPMLVQVAGLGQTRFRTANQSAAERTLNRRVEVRILSLSKTRARLIEQQLGGTRAQEAR